MTASDARPPSGVDPKKSDAAADDYVGYRDRLDRFDPARQASDPLVGRPRPDRVAPVSAHEWDLYLRSGTAFDRAVRAILDRSEGWAVDFVILEGERKSLDRIEIRLGSMSVTLWSRAGSAKVFL